MKISKSRLKIYGGVAAIVIFLLIGFSALFGFLSPTLSVSEVSEKHVGKNIQVYGYVVKESISWIPGNLNFTITDGKSYLNVIYYGTLPANFPIGQDVSEKSRIEVLITGKLVNKDTIVAKGSKSLLVRCPSKYQEIEKEVEK